MTQDTAQRNATHKLICNGTDGYLNSSTRERDLRNLEKALAVKPLKPPGRRK